MSGRLRRGAGLGVGADPNGRHCLRGFQPGYALVLALQGYKNQRRRRKRRRAAMTARAKCAAIAAAVLGFGRGRLHIVCAAPIPEQIDAIERGSLAAWANARNAAIGAINCTRIASSTIGMSSSSRRRIIAPKTPRFSYHPGYPPVENSCNAASGGASSSACPWRIGHMGDRPTSGLAALDWREPSARVYWHQGWSVSWLVIGGVVLGLWGGTDLGARMASGVPSWSRPSALSEPT